MPELADLNPQWFTPAGAEGRHGVGVAFDCFCPSCKRDEEPARFGIPFTNPLDNGPPLAAEATWDRTGEELETLTIGDSIRVPGHGTFTITQGDVEWSPFVYAEPEALSLVEVGARFLHIPAKNRYGLGIQFACPHCPDDDAAEIRILFANPLDDGTPAFGDGLRWHRTGGINEDTRKTEIETLSVGMLVKSTEDDSVAGDFQTVEIDLGEHGKYTIEKGHLLGVGR